MEQLDGKTALVTGATSGIGLAKLHEAEALAEKIGLSGELWQIQSRIGELCVQSEDTREARAAFSRAAQTLRDLAQKIGDEALREGFRSAPRVRCVLEHH